MLYLFYSVSGANAFLMFLLIFANCNIVDLTDTLHLMPADAKLHEGQMQRVWRGHRFAPFTDWVRPVPYLGAPRVP